MPLASQFDLQLFPLRSASDDEYAALARFKNTLRQEFLPDDPPATIAERVQEWRNLPGFLKEACLVVWDPGQPRLIACGDVGVYETGDNEHVAEFNIEVLPEFRRQGLGRRLLAEITAYARRYQRRLMLSSSNDRAPGGAAFLTRLGARQGLETHINQLRVADIDPTLVGRWLERSSHLPADFECGWWEAAFPEERLREIANLYQVVANDEPRDSLELEDRNFTPEVLRQWDSFMLAGGKRRWVLYLSGKTDGRIAGVTEVTWSPTRSAILNQGFTAVAPADRSKGLGRWLKAEMLARILRERPEVTIIRTNNANSNAPMLKINTELGFKPYLSRAIWQVETEAVERYLASGVQ